MAPDSPLSTTSRNDDDELVFAAANNKPSLVRSILASAPASRLEAAWPAAITTAAAAGDAYVLEILLQNHQPPHDKKVEAAATKALHTALLTAAEKGHAGVVTLLLKHRPPPRSAIFPPRVIQAAMGRALQGDHANVLQALLDRAKPDPYVRACAFGAEDGDGVVDTPLERAVADGRQRCAGMLRQYEGVWRQHTLQLLVRATLLDSCRLSVLPFAVIGEVLLEYLAGRREAQEEGVAGAHPSIVIEEPPRPVGGKREFELEREEDEKDKDEEVDDQDFPPTRIFLQQGRGRKRRRSGGQSPRRGCSANGGGGSSGQQMVLTLAARRAHTPRKAKTWSEMRKLPLPIASFAGACAF